MKKLFLTLIIIAIAGSFSFISAQEPQPARPTGGETTAGNGALDIYEGGVNHAGVYQELEFNDAVSRPDNGVAAGLKLLIDFNLYQLAIENTFGYIPYRYGYDKELSELFNLDQNYIGIAFGQPILDSDGRFIFKQKRQRIFFSPDFNAPEKGYGYDSLRPEEQLRKYDYRLDSIGGKATKDIVTKIDEANKQISSVRENIMAGQFAKDQYGAPVFTVTAEDMKLDNWLVELNSSANVIDNRRYSYCMEVYSFKNFYPNFVSSDEDNNGKYEVKADQGERTRLDDADVAPKYYKPAQPRPRKYLGVRVHFPTHQYNAYAVVRPPYNFPVFDVAGKKLEISMQGEDKITPEAAEMNFDDTKKDGVVIANDQLIPTTNGVLHNVGQIKYIKARVSGRNYHNGVAIRLRDQNEDVVEYFLGYMDFPGWRTLIWKNPNYITAVPQRDIFRLPLYPQERPYRVFDSFVVYRNGNDLGGNFVTYIWDVLVDYDLAVSPDEYEAVDVNDDYYWKILRDLNVSRKDRQDSKFANRLDLIKQEYARTRRTPNP